MLWAVSAISSTHTRAVFGHSLVLTSALAVTGHNWPFLSSCTDMLGHPVLPSVAAFNHTFPYIVRLLALHKFTFQRQRLCLSLSCLLTDISPENVSPLRGCTIFHPQVCRQCHYGLLIFSILLGLGQKEIYASYQFSEPSLSVGYVLRRET